MKELLIIIPVYNEEMNIIKVINEINRDIDNADILVVNDCSIDSTESILIEKNINYINTPFNMGYSAAVQTGFKYAYEKGYEYVAQFDGDGQHIASELKKMYKLIKKDNVDIVIGSRFVEDIGYKDSIMKKIAIKLFEKIIKIACVTNITDPTSGLQILNRNVFSRYAKMNNYPEYPDANLVIEMILLGYRIEEISVNMREREYGESMHAGILKPFFYMFRMMYSIFVILVKYKGIKKNR